MEKMDDSHYPENVLAQYAIHGIPENQSEVTNHLIACDSCHALYEHHLNIKAALQRSRGQTARAFTAGGRSWFGFAKPALAAAAAVALVMLWIPVQRSTGAVPQIVEVASARGARVVEARSNVPLVLRLDTNGLDVPSDVRVHIADASGTSIWQGAAHLVGSALQTQTDKGLRTGRYWVRIPDPHRPGEMLREFELNVE